MLFYFRPPSTVPAGLLEEGGGPTINREELGRPCNVYLSHLRGSQTCQDPGAVVPVEVCEMELGQGQTLVPAGADWWWMWWRWPRC